MTEDEKLDRPTADPRWDELRADAVDLADDYREHGWDAIVLDPVSVNPIANVEAEPDTQEGSVDAGSGPQGVEQPGLEARVSKAEYDPLEGIVDGDAVTVGDAEVYYRPAEPADDATGDDGGSDGDDGDDSDGEPTLEARRFVIVVERDVASETAVILPLTYSVDEARPVFERALVDEELLIRVRGDGTEPDRWVTFSHDDPSLFLEEGDVRRWRSGE
ncbi:DUF7529 family protein [Halobiforma nitratireducens]|uniref:Uncharacterized protein n=1 Tax=Halobiforma nitratireducens JCM 10879 TaxID=1227454 RepID=M0MBX1_9EURY|nr:hypothetical protein [Halobiforma nitratireducens]EMA41885.1 hypothetical protein C446_04730 [Halobiforma nitratireducens JCM 10879]